MEEIRAGDRIILTDEDNKEWKGVIVNVSDYRSPEEKYCLDLDLYKDDFVFVDESYIRLEQ